MPNMTKKQDTITQPGSKWIAAGIVTMGAFIAFLDTTIIDVVLPKMISSLNTDTFGVQWVIISYMIAGAIAMTTVGWLSSVLGHRNTYLLGLVIFTTFSAVCGQATSIGMMNFARFCQGIGEGIVVPISMIILCEVFPEEERGVGLGIYGLGAVCAPALGPTVGGLITEHLSWRWVFYVNLPIGIIVAFLTLVVLWETGKKDEPEKSFDLPGFVTMAIAFGSFITLLSKGQENGWLQSDFILSLMIIFAVSLPLFIWVELHTEKPLFDLRIFKYRNFTVSMLCMFTASLSLYSIIMILPLYLERFRQFPTLTTGLMMFPGGIIGALGSLVSGCLTDKYDQKKICFVSSIFMFISGLALSKIDLYTERSTVIWLFLLWNTFSIAVIPSVQAMGFGGVPPEKIPLVSCGQNIARLLAGSVGTAIAMTILERRADTFFESFGRTINYGNIAAMNMVRSLEGYLHVHGTAGQLLDKKALKMMELFITIKAHCYAVQSVIFWISIIGLFVVIFCLFMKQQNNTNGVKHVPMH